MNNELIGELMTKYGKFEKISDSYSNNSSNTVNDESEEEEENRDDYEEDADDITEIITIEDQIRGSEDGYRDHYGIKGGEYHKY